MKDHPKDYERANPASINLRLPLITKNIRPDGVWTPGKYKRALVKTVLTILNNNTET